MSELHTSTASLAAALRRAADDLDKAGGIQLSPVRASINLQPVSHRGTSDERKATVDALGMALIGQPGITEDDDDPQHRLDFDAGETRGDIEVRVYTAVADFRPGGVR